MSAAQKLTSDGEPYTECCPVMDLALDRAHVRFGLAREQAISFKTGKTREVTVYRMRRGKKGEAHDKYRDSTFAVIRHCPFCGERVKP